MKIKRVEFGKSVRVDGMQEVYLDLANKHKGVKIEIEGQFLHITSLKQKEMLVPLTNVSEIHVFTEEPKEAPVKVKKGSVE